MLQVRAIECLGIQEDGHRVLERDAVLRRVGLGLPRIPLEHLFSIYEMAGWLDRAMLTRAHGLVRRNCESVLCQNSVTYPPETLVKSTVYGDTSTRIDVVEVVGSEVRC